MITAGLVYLLCLISFALASGAQQLEILAKAVDDITDDSSAIPEIFFISDFTNIDQERLLQHIWAKDMPVHVFNAETFPSLVPESRACPLYQYYDTLGEEDDFIPISKEEVYRAGGFLAMGKRPRFLITWIHSNALAATLNILSSFERTKIECRQKLDMGVFYQQNRLLFISNKKELREAVLDHKDVANHPRTIVLELMSTLVVSHHSQGAVTPLSRTDMDIKEVIAPPKQYRNKMLTVTIYPWAYCLAVKSHAQDKYLLAMDDMQLYLAEMLAITVSRLNLSARVYNPGDWWGYLETVNGTWTNNVGRLASDEADMFLTEVAINYYMNQVYDISATFTEDYFGWASPLPRPLPTYLSFIRPLHPLVWLLIAISIVVYTGILATLGYLQFSIARDMTNAPKSVQSSLEQSMWFTIGALIGEPFAFGISRSKLPVIRICVGSWIIVSLIFAACYSGNLRAHLITPLYESRLDSLEALAESSLDIGIVLDSFEYEMVPLMEQDPVLKVLWERKHNVLYSPTPDLSRVYAGDTVLFEWYTGLTVSTFLRYTKPGFGEDLVDLPHKPLFYKKPIGIGLNLRRPWNDQINEIIASLRDTGTLGHMMLKSLRQMKKDFLASGGLPVEYHEPALISSLTLYDIQGIFMLTGSGILISILAFLGEILKKYGSYR